MTTVEHLDAARKLDESRRASEGKAYTDLIRLKQENAVLRSTIEKLERDIESMKCSLEFYINDAAEKAAQS